SSTEAGAGDGYGNVCSSYSTAIGQLASTTGNMYGVYDMAGGAYQYTQANFGATSSDDDEEIITMPQTKYIDIYYVPPFGAQASWSSSTNEIYYNFDNCLFETCGGQSLHEARTRQSISSSTQSWGGDISFFARLGGAPWFIRGGTSNSGSSDAGLWYSTSGAGGSLIRAGFRVVAQNIAKATSITAIAPFSTIIANNNITTMQTLTSSICQSADYDSSNGGINENNTVTLTDTRNNQQYQVRKLADGKCWMIDNLKLELTDGMVLAPAETNVASNVTVYFTQDGTQTGAPLDGMTDNFTMSGSMTRDNDDTNVSPNYDAWRQFDPIRYGVSGCSSGKSYNTSSKSGCGYLYNFYTTTAGTVLQVQNNGTAVSSICPANWKLPLGTYPPPGGDYSLLNNAYSGSGSSIWSISGAWQVANGGRYVKSHSLSSYGIYWTSTHGNVNVYRVANAPSFYGGSFDVQGYYQRRSYGLAVRCLVG
ncbi:MAG: hypothetical protein LBK50_02810, partial [Candidatus Nomurabacteria bacterium]|nr:hypothetical protein [Candidatus Nomurabacteria bacterium]